MPLIEGVGDEVVQFVATVLAISVVALAWWSTNARLERYRAVVVMRSSRPHHPITVSIRRTRTPNVYPSSATEPLVASSSIPTTEVLREGRTVIPLQEMDSIVDADMAMMNHHRLHFYRRVGSPTNDSAASARVEAGAGGAEGEPAAQAQMREMDSIVSAMEADDAPFPRAAAAAESTTTNSSNETTKAEITEGSQPTAGAPLEGATSAAPEQNTAAPQIGDAKRILIKLKYLNDELKEVEGSLDEMLKDFTWRHFSSELAAESRVRLIFRGRVLGDASATLRALGLHHRATVHALVHPRRVLAPSSPGAASGAAEGELVEAAVAAERSWDLENILMTLVSVALTVVWFFRCEYSNMFTASASMALIGLTMFYSVAIFGQYLSDTFHFDRRPAQAQPIPDN